jgi:hypothetical protein
LDLERRSGKRVALGQARLSRPLGDQGEAGVLHDLARLLLGEGAGVEEHLEERAELSEGARNRPLPRKKDVEGYF